MSDVGEAWDEECINALCQVGPPIAAPPAAPPTTYIEQCGGCGRELQWPAPKGGFWAAPVPCPECGRWYYAEARNDAAPTLTVTVPNPSDSAGPTVDCLARQGAGAGDSLFDRLIGHRRASHERRGLIRQPLTLPIVGVPLDLNAKPTSEAVDLTLLDLSPTGAGLLLPTAPQSPLILLDFGGAGQTGVQAIGAVRWSKTAPLGVKIGVQFLHSPDEPIPLE